MPLYTGPSDILTSILVILFPTLQKISAGIRYCENTYISAQKTYESNIPQVLRFMIDKNVGTILLQCLRR